MGFGLEAYAERHPEKCGFIAIARNTREQEEKPEPVQDPEFLDLEPLESNVEKADPPTPQEMDQAMKFYRDYRRNEKNIKQLKTMLVTGAREGEEPCRLLLQACKAMFFMDGDHTIYDQVEAYIQTVWGKEVLKPKSLTMDIEGAKRRLARLEEKLWLLPEGGRKDTLQETVCAHKGRIAHLAVLKQAEISSSAKQAEANE